MPYRACLLAMLLACHLTAADGPLEAKRTELLALLPEAEVQFIEDRLIVQYRTRTFMVHKSDMRGRFDDQATATTGPSAEGFLIEVALLAEDHPIQATVPQSLQRPYWTTELSSQALPESDQQLLCSLSFGNQPDRAVLEMLRRMLKHQPPPKD